MDSLKRKVIEMAAWAGKGLITTDKGYYLKNSSFNYQYYNVNIWFSMADGYIFAEQFLFCSFAVWIVITTEGKIQIRSPYGTYPFPHTSSNSLSPYTLYLISINDQNVCVNGEIWIEFGLDDYGNQNRIGFNQVPGNYFNLGADVYGGTPFRGTLFELFIIRALDFPMGKIHNRFFYNRGRGIDLGKTRWVDIFGRATDKPVVAYYRLSPEMFTPDPASTSTDGDFYGTIGFGSMIQSENSFTTDLLELRKTDGYTIALTDPIPADNGDWVVKRLGNTIL